MFLTGVIVTGAVTYFAAHALRMRRDAQFAEDVAEVREAIENRIGSYVALLRGTAAMFASDLPVDHVTFRSYVDRLDVREQYPGTLGLGFALRMSPGEVARVERSMREDLPGFSVWPVEERDEYYAIIYIAPLDWRNRRALGYDMFTEERRRLAMERARDTGQPAASGKVRLVQEVSDNPQAGFTLYVPVYRGESPETVEDRRAALMGFAYAPLRVGDLLDGIFQGKARRLEFEVYGDAEARPAEQMFRSTAAPLAPDAVVSRQPLEVAGHPWTIVFASAGGAVAAIWPTVLGVATTGTALSLLLFWVTRAEARARAGAERAAEDLRRSQEALRQSEDRFRVALKHAPIIVVNVGPDLRVTWVSNVPPPGRPEDIVGRHVRELVPAEDAAAALEPLERCLATGAGLRYEFTLRAPDRPRHYDVTIEPLRDRNRAVTGVTAAAFDITDRKRAERALAQHIDELARSNAELEDFAYVASHDLKEPLRGMSNYAKFVLEDAGDRLTAEEQSRLESISRLSQRLHDLLESLLQYSRVGRSELALRRVDLAALAREVLEALRPRLEEERVDARVREPLPEVECDPVQIGQVFSNLVLNAVKYNDRSDKTIEIGASTIDGDTAVFVRDNGIGIAPRHHETIFKMFRRLHARDRYGGGSGAGLAIVKKIVQRHGGRIWVESTPGEGSTFYFTLHPPA